jgi:hypothetical protein
VPRSPAVAFGGVLLALGILSLEVRLDKPWGTFTLLLVAAAGAIGLLALAMVEDGGAERPAPASSVLLLAGIALVAATIYRLAQLLGADAALDAAGSLSWELLLFAAVTLALAASTRSAALLLVGSLAAGGVLLAGVSWIFDTQNAAVFRALLLVLAAAYAAAAAMLTGRHRDVLVDAAGVALLGISFLTGGFFFLLGGHLPDAYEAVLLAGGLALAGYVLWTRAPGPALLSVLVLFGFVVSVVVGEAQILSDEEQAGHYDSTLAGWPIILLLAAGASLAYGILRSRDD